MIHGKMRSGYGMELKKLGESPTSDDQEISNELTPAELEDPQLREAMQSQKVAESLAAEAKLTWQKAQEATAALRKDRGFGAVTGGKSNGKTSTSGCFICGHPSHLARDCPDKWAPRGKGKSKSKFGMVAVHRTCTLTPTATTMLWPRARASTKVLLLGSPPT